MADICITETHKLPHIKAKAAAQEIAEQMAAEYDMTTRWHGDVLQFKRSGVSGTLTLSDKEARLEIALDFLLKAFAPTIEQKISAKMKKVFAVTA